MVLLLGHCERDSGWIASRGVVERQDTPLLVYGHPTCRSLGGKMAVAVFVFMGNVG
jgi:hypothetical protein